MSEHRYGVHDCPNGYYYLRDVTDHSVYVHRSYGKLYSEYEEDIELVSTLLNELADKVDEQQARIKELEKENEQLHHKLKQIKEYLQIKIDECKNHKKMKEIVFGVEQAVGYEKALLQFQKGLKRRLNDE